MPSSSSIYVGVETASTHKAFTYAALDRELNVLRISDAELDELLSFLSEPDAATVAVNAPSHVNLGLVRGSGSASKRAGGRSRQLRGVEMRLAEHELRERGIAVSGTPARESLCPEWMRLGIDLYRQLSKNDFEDYPAPDCTRLVLETHPHAAFCVLLGRVPLSKPSFEGRLQRELALFEAGLRIRDPMLFFEEITRHRLLAGSLPLEMLHTPERLDALVAAYTAWSAVNRPSGITRLGSPEEGMICLPAANLKEKYQ